MPRDNETKEGIDMAAIEKGRVCIITAGRRSGEKVVITKDIGTGFVMVQDKKGKERKVSIKHLDPTEKKA